MQITIDLEHTADMLQENIQKWVKVIPDEMLLQALDHFQHEEEISEQGAKDLIRAGLKGLLILEHRQEMRRRLEDTAR